MALGKFDFILEKNAIFCVLAVFKKGIKKRTKETHRSPLFTGTAQRHARVREKKKICKKYYPLDIIIYSHCRHLVKKCDNYYFYNSFPALFFIGKNQILSYSHNDDFR